MTGQEMPSEVFKTSLEYRGLAPLYSRAEHG